MSLELEHAEGVVVIRLLKWRLEQEDGYEIKEAVAGQVAAGKRFFILDLERVAFVDSGGLGLLISSLKQLEGDGDLVLSGIRENIFNLFRLTRMDRVFRIYPDLAAAKNSMQIP